MTASIYFAIAAIIYIIAGNYWGRLYYRFLKNLLIKRRFGLGRQCNKIEIGFAIIAWPSIIVSILFVFLVLILWLVVIELKTINASENNMRRYQNKQKS